MTTPAIVMMIVAVLTVWGGLVLSLLHLRRSPEIPDQEQGPDPVEDPAPTG